LEKQTVERQKALKSAAVNNTQVSNQTLLINNEMLPKKIKKECDHEGHEGREDFFKQTSSSSCFRVTTLSTYFIGFGYSSLDQLKSEDMSPKTECQP